MSELSEIIFSHLPSEQVWKLYEVNCRFRDVIEAYHKLQVKLGLKLAVPQTQLEILHKRIWPLRYRAHLEPVNFKYHPACQLRIRKEPGVHIEICSDAQLNILSPSYSIGPQPKG